MYVIKRCVLSKGAWSLEVNAGSSSTSGWAHRDGLTLWSIVEEPRLGSRAKHLGAKAWYCLLCPGNIYPLGPGFLFIKWESCGSFSEGRGACIWGCEALLAVAVIVWVAWGSKREHELRSGWGPA